MQNVKTIKTTSATTKTIAMSAMFAALVTVTTAFIKIPTPVGGYVHPGDSMVYLAASVLPGPFGLIAAAVGGALADLISGLSPRRSSRRATSYRSCCAESRSRTARATAGLSTCPTC